MQTLLEFNLIWILCQIQLPGLGSSMIFQIFVISHRKRQSDYKHAKDALDFELLNTAPGGLKNPLKFSEIQDDIHLDSFDGMQKCSLY